MGNAITKRGVFFSLSLSRSKQQTNKGFPHQRRGCCCCCCFCRGWLGPVCQCTNVYGLVIREVRRVPFFRQEVGEFQSSTSLQQHKRRRGKGVRKGGTDGSSCAESRTCGMPRNHEKINRDNVVDGRISDGSPLPTPHQHTFSPVKSFVRFHISSLWFCM